MTRLGLILALGLVAQSVSSAADADLERLAAARDRWQAANTGDYVYAYEKYCECYRNEQPQTVVTVSDVRDRSSATSSTRCRADFTCRSPSCRAA